MPRLLPSPDRDHVREDEHEYFDGVVDRERKRGLLDEQGKVPGYYGALLNSPGMAFHISSLGRLVRPPATTPGPTHTPTANGLTRS